jgi:hypothetical protein
MTATIDGQPIYDIDLAQMDDKPWRKPGADITDYFNYGFVEGNIFVLIFIYLSTFRNLECLL